MSDDQPMDCWGHLAFAIEGLQALQNGDWSKAGVVAIEGLQALQNGDWYRTGVETRVPQGCVSWPPIGVEAPPMAKDAPIHPDEVATLVVTWTVKCE